MADEQPNLQEPPTGRAEMANASSMQETGAYYARMFQKRMKSLELTLQNKTKKTTLKFSEEYFSTGTWYEHFSPGVILHGEYSKALVANKPGALTGVSGGLMFTMEVRDGPAKKLSKKYVLIGFINPLFGTCKTFISISDELFGAKYAFDNAKDDKHKLRTIGKFEVEAILTHPQEGGNKQIVFTISDV